MSREAVMARLGPIFREILDPDLTITEDLDASKVSQWDSLNHISLVVAIESEFGVELTVSELATIKNVGDMVTVLKQKAVSPG